MKAYDIYYKSERINDLPIDKSTLQKVMEKKFIYKKNRYNGDLQKIPTNEIVPRMCTII